MYFVPKTVLSLEEEQKYAVLTSLTIFLYVFNFSLTLI